MHARHSDGSFKLPLDINGCVDGFKSVTGMTKVPMYEPLDSDPVTIEKFNLDLNTADENNTIDIDCEMLRFDFWFDQRQDFYDKMPNIMNLPDITSSFFSPRYDFSKKIFGFSDNIYNLSNGFLIYKYSGFKSYASHLTTPKSIVGRSITCLYSCFGEQVNGSERPNNLSLDFISENLFKHCPNLISLDCCFAGIITSDSNGISIYMNIPERLLYYNTNLLTMINFLEMSNISVLPKNLFLNQIKLKTLEGALNFNITQEYTLDINLFKNCRELESLRGALEVDCFNDVNMSKMFESCKETLSDISNIEILSNDVKNEVVYPEFWDKTKFPNIHSSYQLYGVSRLRPETKALILNYSDIPICFGGEKKSPRPDFADKVDYYFESLEDLNSRIDSIISENNGDLINKTFGFSDDICTFGNFYDEKNKFSFMSKPIISTPKSIYANHLTDVCKLFASCGIKTISDTLFDNCPGISSFRYCFFSCNSLTSIPSGLFKNQKVASDYLECFSFCGSLVSIPSGLFDDTMISIAKFCFRSCNALTSAPIDLFYKSKFLRDVSFCFSDSPNITSALPDVWNFEKHPSMGSWDGYAKKCTKAANYNETPADFK